jgi:hypothetical protein
MMFKLELDHTEVYRHFKEGHHVLRRTDRFWGGLATDLTIEQILMRSVKSSGGLTRGRGIGDAQRAQWILSMPACADYNSAMHGLTGVGYFTSDQHKEASHAEKNEIGKILSQFLSTFVTEILLLPMFLCEILKQAL